MASSAKSEFDEDDGTQGVGNLDRISKRKDSYTKRDSKTEGNWRSQRYESQCSSSSGNWKTTRQENRRSDVDGNWRTKSGENSKIDIKENWRSTRGREDTLENFKIIYSQNEVHGCWRILTRKRKESEDVWDAVEELHKELPRLFSVPPRKWSLKRYSTEFIESFTTPSCSKEQIKEAADAIRNKVYFPFVMVYVVAPFELNKLQEYQHTPENEFYELENKLWKIAFKEDSDTVDCERDESSSQDSKSEGFKTNTPCSSRMNKSFAPASLSNQVLLPSQVMDKEYLYFPSTKEAIGKMKRTIGGKWLVYGGFSMAKQDNMWSNLLPLCKEGVLIGIKASTAIITDDQQYMGGEVILCYTADANDVNGVKKAGDAIRRAIGSKYILYYKTNASSERGWYTKEGCHSVTSYMHTAKGTLYARDKYKRWTLEEL